MKKLIAILVAVLLIVSCVAVLAACSGDTELVIWVGEESQEYYAKVLDQWAEENDCKYKIRVEGIDSSTAAGAITKDAAAGPAIFTVPHDNLGKLLGANPVIAAITDQDLLRQIEEDNPDGYKDVIKGVVGGKEYTFAVPYIGQALVLFYNKDIINEEQVKTWEGIQTACRNKGSNVKATTFMGNDSYNLSFFQLATTVNDHYTSVVLYQGATVQDKIASCKFTGDDNVARFRWAQRFFNDPNGGQTSGSTGFESMLQNGTVASLVGGAWKYDGVAAALGDKLGIAELPTFTITSEDAYGTCTEGTVFKSGTFADAKVLCINAMNKVTQKDKALLEKIIMYMSSKEIQEGSFEEANNLPTYKNAAQEFEAMQADTNEALLARMQISMADWGIAQPFGFSAALNTLYYSSGQDTLTQDILLYQDTSADKAKGTAFKTGDEVKEGLQRIENILKNIK